MLLSRYSGQIVSPRVCGLPLLTETSCPVVPFFPPFVGEGFPSNSTNPQKEGCRFFFSRRSTGHLSWGEPPSPPSGVPNAPPPPPRPSAPNGWLRRSRRAARRWRSCPPNRPRPSRRGPRSAGSWGEVFQCVAQNEETRVAQVKRVVGPSYQGAMLVHLFVLGG